MDAEVTRLGLVRSSTDRWGHGLYSADDMHRYWFVMRVDGQVPAEKPKNLHDDGLPRVPPGSLVWIGLNPSRSDDDGKRRAGLTNVVKWAKRDGWDWVLVANLFAYRQTNPANIPRASAADRDWAVGIHNGLVLKHLADSAADIFVAWGAGGVHGGRGNSVLGLLGRPLWCVGKCKNGQPRHPAPRTGWAIDPPFLPYP